MSPYLNRKIVYWRHTMTGEIRMGLPEEYPAPWMFEKIVCGTAHEAECWSQKMREQESARERLENEKREEIEEHMKAQLRSHIRNLMVNARNNMNREFLRRHLELYDERPAGWKTKRKSYLHAEAFEHGR